MTKAKKTKAPQQRTELDRIAARLRTALRRETKNVIEIGNLLIESRKHLEHGEWQSWLAENFHLSDRSALNYANAAEYVASKSETVSDFANLAPTILYRLAAGLYYTEEEEAAILAATQEGRVDFETASAICDALAPDDDDTDDADDQDDSSADDDADPESEAILAAGADPAVPPPAPIPPPTDFRAARLRCGDRPAQTADDEVVRAIRRHHAQRQ
jgi:hypothetical protein